MHARNPLCGYKDRKALFLTAIRSFRYYIFVNSKSPKMEVAD